MAAEVGAVNWNPKFKSTRRAEKGGSGGKARLVEARVLGACRGSGGKCPEGMAPLLSGWWRGQWERECRFQFRSLWMLMFL